MFCLLGFVCITEWRQITQVLTLGAIRELPVARLEGTEVEQARLFFYQSSTTSHGFQKPSDIKVFTFAVLILASNRTT